MKIRLINTTGVKKEKKIKKYSNSRDNTEGGQEVEC